MMLFMKPSTEMGIMKGVEIDGIKNLQFAKVTTWKRLTDQFQQRKEYIGLSGQLNLHLKGTVIFY